MSDYINRDQVDASMVRDGYNVRLSWMSPNGVNRYEYSRDLIMSNSRACELIDDENRNVKIEIWNIHLLNWHQIPIIDIE